METFPLLFFGFLAHFSQFFAPSAVQDLFLLVSSLLAFLAFFVGFRGNLLLALLNPEDEGCGGCDGS